MIKPVLTNLCRIMGRVSYLLEKQEACPKVGHRSHVQKMILGKKNLKVCLRKHFEGRAWCDNVLKIISTTAHADTQA
jgi:hypothetical protein